MRKRPLLVIALACCVLAATLVWRLWPSSFVPPEWAADYDVTAHAAESISPGTVVERSPPVGWSHLVIKSLPRVRASEEAKIPFLARSETLRMTRWMFAVFVADVRPETRGNETRYQLRAVGLGLGTSVGGKDIVITPETAASHGVELNWVTRTILTKGYETQRLATVVVHGPTFALVDTPVWFRCGDKNRLIRFRYGLVVDVPTGRLDVLVWVLDPVGGCGDSGSVVRLNPDQIDEAELIPDPSEFDVLSVPSDAAFGVDRLPPHRSDLGMPTELRELATKTKFNADDARTLEAGLRRLLPSP